MSGWLTTPWSTQIITLNINFFQWNSKFIVTNYRFPFALSFSLWCLLKCCRFVCFRCFSQCRIFKQRVKTLNIKDSASFFAPSMIRNTNFPNMFLARQASVLTYWPFKISVYIILKSFFPCLIFSVLFFIVLKIFVHFIYLIYFCYSQQIYFL